MSLWAESGEFSGQVQDRDGSVLPGANILVEGGGLTEPRGTTTDLDGRYSIKGIPDGVYTVTISYIGYKTILAKQVSIGAQAGMGRDFIMESTVVLLNQSVVSASRAQEKALDAPASISVVEAEQVQNMPALSVADHVRSLPAVDFSKTGLVQSNVVVRGFNNIFSGALLTLTDNRIARVPSLRVNTNNFIPVTNDDIERIEVVLGPGSALYGPNSANGVMHIITQSPFNSVGTNVNVGIGERSLKKVSLRQAGLISDDLGYKISAQYYDAADWKYSDPEEVLERDFDIKRQSAEVRLDYRPSDDMTAILTAGHNKSDHIEMTGIGAGQGDGWMYNFIQGRVMYRDWFAQVYHNRSDAGDTKLLRSGSPIVDKSSLTVFQLQHAANLGQRQRFIYGVDALLTRPDTEGTINGANEDDDSINELGLYLQSESQLTELLNLVGALRYDRHSRLKDPEISLRGAVVFKPTTTQTLRLTYNNAFSTPSTNNLYLDLVSSADPFGLGAAFGPTLGYEPGIDVRAQGTYDPNSDEGFTFRRSANGRPMFRSPFAPVGGLAPDAYVELDDPFFTNVMWGLARGAVLAQFAPQVEGLVTQQLVAAGVEAGTAQAQAQALAQALPAVIPEQLPNLANNLGLLNAATLGFDPVSDVRDVPRTKSTITHTIELGYKGVIGKKLVVAADLYRTQMKDFVGALGVETPNVFLESQALGAVLQPAIEQALAGLDPIVAGGFLALDQVQIPGVIEGNGNGSVADEFTQIIVPTAASIPFGTVTPDQANDPHAVLATYRNFGDVTLNGLDLSLAYYPTELLTLNGSYSYVSDNLFKNVGGIADVPLNAPKNKVKFGASYRLPDWDVQFGGQLRYTDSFPMNSGVYVGTVDSYTTVDLQLVYALPLSYDIKLRINASNILNKKYRSFVGAPKIGRMVFAEFGIGF